MRQAQAQPPAATRNEDRMFVDHHCHLDFPDFASDRDDVIKRARAAGVKAMVTISTRVRRLADSLSIAEAYENVYCSLGTHPHYAHEELDIPAEEMVALSEHPKIVAIGEAGLDYHYDNSPRSAQMEGFLRQIAVARTTQLPLVIHARDADDDIGTTLESEMARGTFAAVLHCFTGGPALANRAAALGLYISFSGILTFKGSSDLRAIAANLPLDRLLVETDAPYLAPGKHRGKRNEPAFVIGTAAELARVKGLSEDQIAAATTENFLRLYRKVPRAALEA
jgi:TatD DNase family protein